MKLDQAKDTAVEKMFGRENKPTVDGRIRGYMKNWLIVINTVYTNQL